MKTKEEILKWLRQHNWYQLFRTKIVNCQEVTFDEFLSREIARNCQDSIITGAFDWGHTIEEIGFWSKINDTYLKWLNTDNTNKIMKQTIEIEVPEGKKAVWKDGKVVFEDIKPELPRTWEEFCKTYPEVKKEYYIDFDSDAETTYKENRNVFEDRNLLPSKEAAEAHLALMQLHQLRDCYRQGWVPDWGDTGQDKYGIRLCVYDRLAIIRCHENNHFLSFQTKNLAEEFLHNFEDLIRKAGDLI